MVNFSRAEIFTHNSSSYTRSTMPMVENSFLHINGYESQISVLTFAALDCKTVCNLILVRRELDFILNYQQVNPL